MTVPLQRLVEGGWQSPDDCCWCEPHTFHTPLISILLRHPSSSSSAFLPLFPNPPGLSSLEHSCVVPHCCVTWTVIQLGFRSAACCRCCPGVVSDSSHRIFTASVSVKTPLSLLMNFSSHTPLTPQLSHFPLDVGVGA